MAEEKRQNMIVNVIIFFIFFSICLLGVELVLHKIKPQQDEYILDQKLKVVGNPASGRDKNGYRNYNVPQQVDVVAIGDSQTDGYLNAKKIEDSWPHALGTLLEKDVYQVALAGYGPVQYNFLLKQALDFNPQTIMVGFYLGNDLFDVFDMVYQGESWIELRDKNFSFKEPIDVNITDENFVSLKYAYKKGSLQFKIMEARQWLRQNSFIFSFLSDITVGVRDKFGLADTKEKREQRLDGFAQENQDLLFFYNQEPKTTLSPYYRTSVIDLDDKRIEEAFRITQQLFLEMNNVLKTKGKKFIVVIIPTKELVYGRYMNYVGMEYSTQLADYLKKEERLVNQIIDFCKTNQIDCVEPADDLVVGLKDKKEIYPADIDGHPTAEGYKVIAESVFKYWQQKNNTTTEIVSGDQKK